MADTETLVGDADASAVHQAGLLETALTRGAFRPGSWEVDVPETWPLTTYYTLTTPTMRVVLRYLSKQEPQRQQYRCFIYSAGDAEVLLGVSGSDLAESTVGRLVTHVHEAHVALARSLRREALESPSLG